MSAASATQEVQVSVGKDFVIMGSDRIEVSPDGKKVTAYTNDGVETKVASGEVRVGGISISADFNKVVLNGATIERAADGHLVISSSGTVITKPGPANDTASKATHEIPLRPVPQSGTDLEMHAFACGGPGGQVGAIESTGKHKGQIYGGIWSKGYDGDDKPIWFLAAPEAMDHFDAAAWARVQGGSLPTRQQGDYLTTLKGKGGAFTEIFNRGNSFPDGHVWLEVPDIGDKRYAWFQRLSDGDQNVSQIRFKKLPVLASFR